MSTKLITWGIIIVVIFLILMNRDTVLSWVGLKTGPMRTVATGEAEPMYQHIVTQQTVKNIMDAEALIPVSDFQMVSFATNIRDNSRDIMEVLANRKNGNVYFSQQYGRIIGDAQAIIASAKAIRDITSDQNILNTMDSIIRRTQEIIDLSKR